VTFIDACKDRFGVQPICSVLTGHGWKIAPSTYYAAKARQASARALRDERLKTEIKRVFEANYSVYGADKIWRQLNREGIRVARCTVERLMRDLGIAGARRGKKVRATVRDDGHQRAADLLNRDFTAPAPNRRWVADFTHVATWAGVVYVAFVVDVFSRAIVGWSAATNKRASLVLNALQMALWRRDRAGQIIHRGLIHHSDAGSQGGFNWSSQHLGRGGVDGQASGLDEGADRQVADEVAGQAVAATRCGAVVLA
jgi:putative transposase